jgi:hypothetical protein
VLVLRLALLATPAKTALNLLEAGIAASTTMTHILSA